LKVHAIHAAIESYIRFLQSNESDRWTYVYDIIEQLHTEWQLDAPDLKTSFDKALDSSVSRRLWHRENFDAKGMMLHFLEIEPDYSKQMFRDLYDESRAVEARIDRFKFYCDELMQLFRQKYPKEIMTSHDQDVTIISLYLTAKYPTKYAIYPGMEVFKKALIRFESPQPLLIDDPGRFFKVCKVLQTMGLKNQILKDALSERFHQFPEQMKYRQWTSELVMIIGSETST